MKRLFLQVGVIIKPHGIRGEVGVKSLTERPDLRFRPEEKLWLGPDEDHLEQVSVRSARTHKQGYLVHLDSYDDRNAVEGIRGWKLFIPIEQAAEPGEGRFYHHQLIGLSVLDEDGTVVGRVSRVVENPGQDLLEVGLAGRDEKKALVPLVGEIVREVDPEAGTLTVRLPQGLLDI
ncbi:MAG: ribosome maturation factor RimM [Candidatus Glassbacteria bacterium]|nr:ribosome maturation factor RimM [Candidatus Glassbacteria bacterium]